MSNLKPFILVYDLETVYPHLKTPTGLFTKDGDYKPDPFQIYCAKIWQFGCTTEKGDYEFLCNPKIPFGELSVTTKKFLKDQDIDLLNSIPQEDTFDKQWNKFCKWLIKNAGENKDIILVAQQAKRNDEIILSLEMARYQLKWPEGMKIHAIDALFSIKNCLIQQGINSPSWSVSALSKLLNGRNHKKAHHALDDAKCLLANLKTCWGLKMMSYVGIICPLKHLTKVESFVEKINWLFWPTVMAVLEWIPETPKDHRQSIWSLTSNLKLGAALPKELEKSGEIFTIADLIFRSKNPRFSEKICENQLIKDNWERLFFRGNV